MNAQEKGSKRTRKTARRPPPGPPSGYLLPNPGRACGRGCRSLFGLLYERRYQLSTTRWTTSDLADALDDPEKSMIGDPRKGEYAVSFIVQEHDQAEAIA